MTENELPPIDPPVPQDEPEADLTNLTSTPIDDPLTPASPISDSPIPQPQEVLPGTEPQNTGEPVRTSKSQRKKRGSVFFPLLLIVLGLVLLLNNLNFLPGSTWEMLISLWPVLFIAWGLDSIWREEGLTGAVFLLGLGVVFLLGNFGYLLLNPWKVLWIIWPVLFVAIGIDILIGRHRTWWTNLIGLFLIVAIMVGALWFAGVGIPGGKPGGLTVVGEPINYELQGVTRSNIELKPSVATLEIGGQVDPQTLLSGTIPASTPNQQIIQEYARLGDTANLTLRSAGVPGYLPSTSGAQAAWKIAMTQKVPIDLVVSLGAGDGTLDLTGLQISDLDVKMGVGNLVIIFPETGKFNASIDGAIGQITLVVPPGMEIKLESNSLLVAKKFPSNYDKTGDIYSTQNFNQADAQVVLDLGMVFGQVTIQEK